MQGLPTTSEREQALAMIEDVQSRILANTLDRDTVEAVRKAMADFGSKYTVPHSLDQAA